MWCVSDDECISDEVHTCDEVPVSDKADLLNEAHISQETPYSDKTNVENVSTDSHLPDVTSNSDEAQNIVNEMDTEQAVDQSYDVYEVSVIDSEMCGLRKGHVLLKQLLNCLFEIYIFVYI